MRIYRILKCEILSIRFMKQLPNILIVDDDREQLHYIKTILQDMKINLLEAYSGPEALKKINGMDLALAIIDVRMHGMNGFELACIMNKERPGNTVPIIFLTGDYYFKININEGYSAGAIDLMFKPVDNQILESKVKLFVDLFIQKQTIIRSVLLLKKSTNELTKVNAKLKKSEERYRLMIETTQEAVVIAQDGLLKFVNPMTLNLLEGYSMHELIGRPFLEFIHPDDRSMVLENYQRRVANDAVLSRYAFRVVTREGIVKWAEINAALFAWQSKPATLNFLTDITERKQAELAMKESEEKYRTILNASPDGIFLTDLKGIITEVSEIGLELFGAETKEDLVGEDIFRFVPSDEKNTLKEIIEKTMNEGLAQNIGIKIKRKNQSVFDGETSATLIQGPDGTSIAFMIIIRDISQRKRLETIQIHADRMASLGEMASGIAHEINQPLNIISMVVDKILFESSKTESIDLNFLKTKADKIFENIIRIRNIIDHIRTFSRSQDDYVLIAFNLNSSIENAASMLAEQFKHLGIKLDLKLDKQIPQLLGNTYKFEQVILNLLGNAKDAVIEKKSKQEESFKKRVGIRSYQENHSIIVEVTDNGIGISNDDFHNVMLPFYTTKDAGKGTGLGLSICYQIIKEIDVTIDITSDELNGTKIIITLDSQMKM